MNRLSIIIAALLIGTAYAADIDKACMTKPQAAAKFPGKWLYWHTPQHCWNDQPGHFASRVAVYGKQNSLKLPPPPTDASGNVAHHSGRPIEVQTQDRPTVAYPTLMIGGGTVDSMLRPASMTAWPLIADFDNDPPQFIPWRERVSFMLEDNGNRE